MYCSSSFDVKLYNAGKSAIERIDFICSSSLEQGSLLLIVDVVMMLMMIMMMLYSN